MSARLVIIGENKLTEEDFEKVKKYVVENLDLFIKHYHSRAEELVYALAERGKYKLMD